jgi:hypothetical protein
MSCTRTDAGNVTIFICGPAPKAAPCSRRGSPHTDVCATCGAKLCGDHVRYVGAEVRCATHAANVVSANMPRPPGRRPQ